MANNEIHPDLVRAYEVVCYGDEETVCAFYCTTADGTVWTTGYRAYTAENRNNFDIKGDQWTRTEEIPGNAYFIGQYKIPNQIRAAA